MVLIFCKGIENKSFYHFSHDPVANLNNLTNFEKADDDFDPICLKNKFWELVKLDIVDALENENF